MYNKLDKIIKYISYKYDKLVCYLYYKGYL